MKKTFEFEKQRSADRIVEFSFYFVKRHFKNMLRILWKYNALIIVFFFMSYFLYSYKFYDSTNFLIRKSNQLDSNNTIYLIISGGLLILSAILFFPRIYASIFGYIRVYKENAGMVEDEKVHHYIKTKFWGFIGLAVLSGFLFFIGFVLFIIPGIYFIIPLSISYAVYFFEDISPSEAISKSFKYVKGNWWSSFLALFLMGVIVGLIGFVFNAPIQIYTVIKSLSIEKEINTVYQNGDIIIAFLSVISAVAQYMLKSLSMITVVLVYFNLREKMTKSGALKKIDQIGKIDE